MSLLSLLVSAALMTTPGESRIADSGAAEPQIRAVVVLVVLEEVRPGRAAKPFPTALVDAVEAALEQTYQVEVRRVAAAPLPGSAWYAPRKRYRADVLLEHLGELVKDAPWGTRVLGLTTVDISTSKGNFADWGVFGLGEVGGTAAVVSGYRLWRKTKDAQKIAWRVTTTAVHELGHVLGLDHCEEPRCVMLDAEGGIANTDGSSGAPGPGCRAKLEARVPLKPRARLIGP